MHATIAYGHDRLELEVQNERLVQVQRAPISANLADPAAAVAAALESPHGFPALRRALTPDDEVVIVVDERLPNVAALLTAVLEHVTQAHVRPEAITLLCLPPSTGQPWLEQLPEAFQDVHIEVHDPAQRKRLSYLATTRKGRRVYLNRTAVDAAQSVVLTLRGYDCYAGYAGGAAAIFPALSDETTRQQGREHLSLQAPDAGRWPARQEAAEVAWLLGSPFFIQCVAGSDGGLAQAIGGVVESCQEGERLQDARWRLDVDRPADLVMASISGDPAQHAFADLARALAAAARVVKPGGRIALLTAAEPALGEAATLLRQHEEPAQALKTLREHPLETEHEAAFQWASAAAESRIYLLSKLSEDVAEELFAIPLEHARQVQRLVSEAASCLLLPDAHRSLAVVRGP
jgi:nickel-dependent lactate racemase